MIVKMIVVTVKSRLADFVMETAQEKMNLRNFHA